MGTDTETHDTAELDTEDDDESEVRQMVDSVVDGETDETDVLYTNDE